MVYEDLIRDFAKRTQINLEVINDLKRNGNNVFEVTQLINSMLGLLVFPQQRWIAKIPKTPITELATNGWPIPEVEGDFPQVQDLNQLISYLRNGIAHCNIKFVGIVNEEIHQLIIWNMKYGKKNWEARLNVPQLKQISDKLFNLLLD